MSIQNIPSQSEAAEREEKAGKLLAEAIQLLSQQNRITPTEASIAKGETCQTFDIIEVPLYIHTVAAGLPADSTGNVEESFDLPRHMVCHPSDTYAVRACGDSMIGAGIEEDDILIVDKALEPQSNNIVIASINGEQTVKRLIVQEESIYLAPENHKYPITEITEEMDFRTLGVVTWVIRRTG
ncbi:DNA polymerase V [Prosthecochloris sp. ZM]|nr:DNA polymerase V [Prosthecochloris sp. ZM]